MAEADTSALKLYTISGSPYARRVEIALLEKGIEFELIVLSGSKKENKTPEYLAISPRGKVPTLVHGDYAISESVAILHYLERAFPDSKQLVPADAAKAGKVLQLADEVSYLITGQKRIRPFLFGKEIDDEELAAGFDELKEQLAYFETAAQKVEGPYLFGEEITFADVTAYPVLAFLVRLGYNFTHFPALATFVEAFAARESGEKSIPGHWVGTTGSGLLARFNE
eukprot:PLAT11902.1.p2 GENE.PLAT11902.1~~PLAT11902.1.p2  ORF type:complete len:226 (-),score=108.79 PLAT11902.1:77-754(-)